MRWLILFLLLIGFVSGWCNSVFADSRRNPDTLLVHLFDAQKSVNQMTVKGPVQLTQPKSIRLPKQSIELERQQNQICLKGVRNPICSGKLVIQAVTPQGIGLQTQQSKSARWYGGEVSVSIQNQQLYVINTVPSALYIQSVVGSELLSQWRTSAYHALIEAQAILVRTRLKQIKTFPIPDSTTEASYLGMSVITPAIAAAEARTRGQFLTKLVSGKQGPLVPIYYHSTCAGKTTSAGYFKGRVESPDKDNQKITPCSYCKASPFWKPHTTVLLASTFSKQVLNSSDPFRLEVLKKDASGRPLQVKVNGKTMTGYAFWLKVGQALGWGVLPGTRYDIQYSDKTHLKLTSWGAGHGIGMCQWGAATFARQGWTAKKILQFYFPTGRVIKQ